MITVPFTRESPYRRVAFYAPHVDGMGCHVPKPPALTEALQGLEGACCSLSDALATIRAAAPDAVVEDWGGYIRVSLGPVVFRGPRELRKYNYCAIKYREIGELHDV
jgi:hypothetical protein